MSEIAVCWLLVSVFSAVGILLCVVARPMVKFVLWLQSYSSRQSWFQVSVSPGYDERMAVIIIRMVGVFFVVFAVIGVILLAVLPYLPPSKLTGFR